MPRRSSISQFMKLLSKDNGGTSTKKTDSCTVNICELPTDDLNFV